jgi:hypothetical protein
MTVLYNLENKTHENEMVQGHVLTCSYMRDLVTVVLDRLNVIIDRLNVISSGSVHPCLSEQGSARVSHGTKWDKISDNDHKISQK